MYLLAQYLSTATCVPGDGKRALELNRQAAAPNYALPFPTSGESQPAIRITRRLKVTFFAVRNWGTEVPKFSWAFCAPLCRPLLVIAPPKSLCVD